MVKLLINATIALHTVTVSAQPPAITLCTEYIKLNGGIRSTMGGRSRVAIPISVTSNTYSILLHISISNTEQAYNPVSLTAKAISILSANSITDISSLLYTDQ